MKNFYFLILSLLALTACDYTGLTIINEVHEEENGVLVMEAEHPNEASPMVEWSTDRLDNTTFVAMEKTSESTDSAPTLLYKMEITKPGTYSIWIKAKGITGTNAFALSVNQEIVEIQSKDAVYDEFVWFTRNAYHKLKKGENTLQLLFKDENFHPDSIMLLHNQQQTPAGNIELSAVMEKSNEMVQELIQARENQQLLEPYGNIYGNYSLGEAYHIQWELSKRLKADLGDIVGYKLAFATDEAMENSNLNEPVYGPLFEKQQIENKGNVDLSEFMQFHIENELAFVLAEDIHSPVSSIEELKDKVSSLHLSFDMADARFDRSAGREGVNDFIASGGGAHRYILGEPAEGIDYNLVNKILLLQHNDNVVYKGSSDNVYGNPWKALLWVVNDLIENQRPVKKNMVFLSGKVDSPYTPEKQRAPGMYIGSAEGFPDVSCQVME